MRERDEYFNKENKKNLKIKTDERIQQLEKQRKESLELTECIIVDVDGTLSLMNGRQIYNSDESVNDQINYPVRDIVNMFDKNNMVIILLTGRSESERENTQKFLASNNVSYDQLIMRKDGDQRKDSIIKKELYEEHIKGIYHVLFWLDDRDQIIEMVRDELGLPCFQVYYGAF